MDAVLADHPCRFLFAAAARRRNVLALCLRNVLGTALFLRPLNLATFRLKSVSLRRCQKVEACHRSKLIRIARQRAIASRVAAPAVMGFPIKSRMARLAAVATDIPRPLRMGLRNAKRSPPAIGTPQTSQPPCPAFRPESLLAIQELRAARIMIIWPWAVKSMRKTSRFLAVTWWMV